MKKALLILGALFLISPFAQQVDEWVWILNNKDLSNWDNTNSNVFEFIKGPLAQDSGDIELAIQPGYSPSGHYFLILKAQPMNYVLEWEAKTRYDNGGVQFRSHGSSTQFHGPQADIGPNWSGRIYGEGPGGKVISERTGACDDIAREGDKNGLDKWDRFRLEVVERVYHYFLNGERCTPPGGFNEGAYNSNQGFPHTDVPGGIALQHHAGTFDQGASYRNMRIKQTIIGAEFPVEIPGITYDPRCDEARYRDSTKIAGDDWNCAALCTDTEGTAIDSMATHFYCAGVGDSSTSVTQNLPQSVNFKGSYSLSEVQQLVRDSKVSLFDISGNRVRSTNAISQGIYYIQLDNSDFRRVLVM
jgi:hypothetical protein